MLLLALLWVFTVPLTAAPAPTSTGSVTVTERPESWRDLDRFLVPPQVLETVLSPDGEHLAYRLREEHGSSVWLLETATGATRRLLTTRLTEALYWSTDGEVLFLETPERLAALRLTAGWPRWITHFDPLLEQRLYGVDPTHPHHVLVTESLDEERHRLLRLDADGGVEVVLTGDQPIRSFLLDDAGQVAFLKRVDGLEQVIVALEGGGPRELLRCDALDSCSLIASTDAGRQLWLRARLDGDLWRLVSLDTASGRVTTRHRDPRGLTDLYTVRLDPRGGPPLVAVYEGDRRHRFALDPALDSHLRRIEEQLGDVEPVRVEPRPAGRFWYVVGGGERVHGPRHFLYDGRDGTVREILTAERGRVPRLPAQRLAERRFIRYTASDGMELNGFLTTPSARDLATAPVVVNIHGGPWNHVRPGFNLLAQFLASRGYIVFQPNFRASTGFGLAYVTAARGEFGDGRVQQDILDGLDHLHAQGLGDPDRVVIMGHSFGGFSTLAGLAFSPRRFRAGIALAPPSDLVRALSDVPDDRTLTNGILQKPALRHLLLDFEDPEQAADLRRRSPEQHLHKTERPLLMIAGERDQRVDIVDIRHYAQALHSLGKDVTLLVDEKEGHNFHGRRMRRALLYAMERFLAHHLGGDVVTPPDLEAEEYLRENLELTGASFDAALAVRGQRRMGSGTLPPD